MRIGINQTDLKIRSCRYLARENATGWITNELIGKESGEFEIALYITPKLRIQW